MPAPQAQRELPDSIIVRKLNKLQVLDHIRRAPISRAELAEVLNVSRSTVSAVINDLMSCGLVLERGVGQSRGGRRPIVLEINPNAGRVVGIDLGATHVLAILADLHGRVLAETEAALAVEQGPEACLPQVLDVIGDTLTRVGCPRDLVRVMTNVTAQTTSGVSPVSQAAADVTGIFHKGLGGGAGNPAARRN